MSWLAATPALLRVACHALRERVLPPLDGEARHVAAMIARAMAIAVRELELGERSRAEELALLAAFYGEPEAGLAELRRRLCRELRAGTIPAERAGALRELLARCVDARLAISSPGYGERDGSSPHPGPPPPGAGEGA